MRHLVIILCGLLSAVLLSCHDGSRHEATLRWADSLNRLTSAIYDEDTSGSNIQGLIKGEKVTANKTNELSALRSKFERIATSVQPYEAEPLLEAIAEIDEDCQECVMEEDSLQLQDFEATENLNNNIACYDEYVEYDLNGNITHLQRYGRMQDDTFGTIDNLHVSLNGNQLSSVTDEATKIIYEGAIDFNNANNGQSDYTYNGCGALTSDSGKGIAMIEYDNSNNPLRIQFTNGNVTRYIYTTTGQKLRTIYYTAMPNITVPIGETRPLNQAEILYTDSIDYLLNGSLILRNGRIDKYMFGEGYCQAWIPHACFARPMMFEGDIFGDGSLIVVPTEEEVESYQELLKRWGEIGAAIQASDDFTFYYYNKDHLGNIREVVDEMGNIQQVTNYYPFGTPYSDAQSTINPEFQPFKYNGKELDMMHGLNTLDYGARQYDPVLPVWDRVDPLAEKYYHISPYMYCLGNPVKLVDSDGRKVKLTNNEEDLAAIRETLPHSLREYITANDGFIDKQKMEEGLNAMGDDVSLNYKSLFEIVADDRTVEFSLLDKPHAVNASGNTPKHMITFGPTLYFEADNIGNPAEWITQGGTSISLAPKSHKWTKWDNMQRARLNEDELQFSPNENYQVQINSSMYKNNATHKNGAKAVAHELYGHILYMFRGWDSAHGSNRKVDNQKLENWLQRIGNETDYNFDH